MNPTYKVGQIISYIDAGQEWVNEVIQVWSSFVETENHYIIYKTEITGIVQDVRDDEQQRQTRIQAYTTPQRKFPRSTGVNDPELAEEQRLLMIDYALDTGNKELFMQLTTPALVGSAV